MNVVQLLPALDSGGVERGTVEVANELVRRGHRAIVISAPGRLLGQLDDRVVHHAWPIGKKSPLTARWVLPMRKLLQKENVDILHSRSRVPAWVGYLAWRSLPEAERPRLLNTVHSLYSVSPYSAIMTRGERLIAISETVRSYILRNYPRTDPAKIELIYRGVDPLEFPYGHHPEQEWLRAWHEQFPHLRLARPLLTLPGRIVRRKGHGDFIEMIRSLHQRGVEAHGLVVGGEDKRRPRYAQQVRQHVEDAGLSEYITFTGDRADMADIYSISDIVYCVSRTTPEAFGRTVVEALSVGTPVIGYDLAGVGETLSELLPGGRVPVGDIQALADRTVEFLDQRPEVPPNIIFTRQAMLDQTLELYERMVTESRQGSIS